MTHAAGDIATLIKVANQFYRNLPGSLAVNSSAGGGP